MINDLSAPLKKEDIELRVGATKANGFSLLLYKTARTDINRLNSVLGSKWSNKHFYDSRGLLCCSISIYDETIKEWISREDVGTESNTEKEKGSYSDSFKRAGFRWGIGTELYNSPFIWINETTTEKNGKYYPTINVKKIEVSKYEVNNNMPKIELSYYGKVIFSSFQNTMEIRQENQVQTENLIPKINELVKMKQVDILKFLNHFKVNNVSELNSQQQQQAIQMLQKK